MDANVGRDATRAGFDTARPLRSFYETARDVIVRPTAFFRATGYSRTEAMKGPVIFYIAAGLVSVLLAQLAAPLDPLFGGEGMFLDDLLVLLSEQNIAAVALIVVAILVFTPLVGLLSLYVGALILHLFVMIFARPRRDFGATLKIVAYAGAVSLLSWIPVIGLLVGLYGLYVNVVGVRELHGTTTLRAVLVVFVPSLLYLAFTLPALFNLLQNGAAG